MGNDRNDQNIPPDPIGRLVQDRTPDPNGSDKNIADELLTLYSGSGGLERPHLPFAPTLMRRSPPTKILALFLLFCVPWSGLGCMVAIPAPDAPLVLPTGSFAGRQSECLPQFPDHDGWYGGDAAYSVPLPIDEGRVSLWLFGDSFVQRPGTPKGRAYPFVHNTIGISHCESGGAWTLETFWHRDELGTPRAFFVPGPSTDWVRLAVRETGAPPYYWPFDGFIAHDILFVGLLRVIRSEPRGPFNLPFRLVGMDLARIENYRDTPTDWRIQISSLSNNSSAFPGSAFVETTSHIYAFAFFDRGDGRTPRMLSRLNRNALVQWQPDLSNALEYLASDSQWRPGFEPDKAKIIMQDDASEMSVHFDSLRKIWIAIYSNLARTGEARIPEAVQIRTARSLAGPWSKTRKLTSIPETDPDHSQSVDENLLCYAAKAHPQFSSTSKLIVTYVCNLVATSSAEALTILQRLRERVDLYRPRAIPVSIFPTLELAPDLD